jgi:hypothetical protein
MSTEPPVSILSEYVTALIVELGRAHPSALERMRHIVGNRHARIVLDDEAVEVFFDIEGRLHTLPVQGEGEAANVGVTDSTTVLDLLDGVLEVSAAVLGDRLRVRGADDDVVRMFAAIEIILDASPRTPPLQSLADRFISERGGRLATRPSGDARVPWYPFRSGESELQLLARLDLIPDDSAES